MRKQFVHAAVIVALASGLSYGACETAWSCETCNSGWLTLRCECRDAPPGWICQYCHSGDCFHCGECCGKNAAGQIGCSRPACPGMSCSSTCGSALGAAITEGFRPPQAAGSVEPYSPAIFVAAPEQEGILVSAFALRPGEGQFSGASLELENRSKKAVVAVAGELLLFFQGASEPVRLIHTAHAYEAQRPLIEPLGRWTSPGINVAVMPKTEARLERAEFRLE